MHLLIRLLPVVVSFSIGGTLAAQLEITAADVPFTVDFNVEGSSQCTTALSWTDNNTIPHCYADRPTYNYSNGCANVGGLHIAGSAGETALGGRSSNSMSSFRWGVRYRNSTGDPISGLQVRARAEQWGQAVSDAPNVVSFGYRSSSSPITDVTAGTYLSEPALDLTNFTAPSGCSGANSAIDGNSPTNSTMLEACLAVTLQPGDEIMLRWYDVNDPCNDHMLCVDDLVVTGLPFPELNAEGSTEICEGGSVLLTVEQADAVTWNTGANGPMLTVTEPGIYTATCSTPCGSVVTLTQEVIVADSPVITVTPNDTALCPGEMLELTAISNAGGLLWSTDETAGTIIVDEPGTYSVTTTSSCGTASATAQITAGEVPTAQITATGGTTFCAGAEVTLIASGGTEYSWTNGHSGAEQMVNTAGTFTVAVSNTCGTDEASITLTEVGAPSVAVTSSSDVICGNEAVILSANGPGPFVWSTGATTTSISIRLPGNYTVTSTNDCGTASTSITILDGRFDASFTATPEEGIAPLEVLAAENMIDTVYFAWDMGNGTMSSEPSVSTTYTEPGIYLITLIATDPNTGCTATTTNEIRVLPGLSWVRLPNVFTPNGDGSNEGLRVEHEALLSLDCSILNRWGQAVGHLKHPDDVWNGRDINGLVPEGTYYYVLNAKGADGTMHALQGSITVLR